MRRVLGRQVLVLLFEWEEVELVTWRIKKDHSVPFVVAGVVADGFIQALFCSLSAPTLG
jgi:hypothetical protein